MEDTLKLELLLQIKLNIIEMLKDRGYEMIEGEKEFFEDFDIESVKNMNESFLFSNTYMRNSEKLFIFFFASEINKKVFVEYNKNSKIIYHTYVNGEIQTFSDNEKLEDFQSKKQSLEKDNKVIIVWEKYKKDDFIDKKKNISFIPLTKILVNPNKHFLASNIKKIELDETYKFKKIEIPKIKEEDPIIFWYNFPKGSILEFSRNILIPGIPPAKDIYYRVVI